MTEFIVPDWPCPPSVRALVTTRAFGNLAGHVADDPAAVAARRAGLRRHLPAEPLWLEQVHGCRCADLATASPGVQADAAVARQPGLVCAVLTADCLPVLFCDAAGSVVAAAHAGWRGLAAGVLEETLAAMSRPPGEVLAWLGPAIGPAAFEVGEEVRAAFGAPADAEAARAFVPAALPGKWLGDLYALARLRLARAGVVQVFGGDHCTWTDEERFFSYRREHRTGRMASLIWTV